MCAETINETINVCKYVGFERKAKTIEGDIILQDIKPDILSIVKLNSKVLINQRKIEENRIRIKGIIDINVVYIADDDTNSQRGANSQIEFNENIDFNGINEDSIIKFKYDVESLEYKVINGRKISIRLPIIFNVKAFNNCSINIVRGILDDESMQTQKMKTLLLGAIQKNTTEIEIKESVKLNEDDCPIGEILNADMTIINREYKLSYNKILAKAEAKIKIVYVADNDNQTTESFETILPVMGFIDIDGINEESKISLDYNIKSFSIRPSYQDLQSNAFSVDSIIEINAYTNDNREVELITDFYIPNAVIKMQNENTHILKNIIDVEDTIELSQTLVVPELDNTDILNIDGNVLINEKNLLNGKIAISGNVLMNVLYSKNDSNIMENKRLELPFQQVIKLENLNKSMNPIVHIELESIDYNPAGENQIQVNIKLIVSIIADEEEIINSITNLEISDEAVPIMPSLVVYYVKNGDTLWNIAKTFRNTVDQIKEMNELTEDTIYAGQRLLIPRYQMVKESNKLM